MPTTTLKYGFDVYQRDSECDFEQTNKKLSAKLQQNPCTAQKTRLEQRIENPRVGGSNPPPGTIIYKALALIGWGFVDSGQFFSEILVYESFKGIRSFCVQAFSSALGSA